MDQDDDVEHLFSWLQTPELRYREFAGAREITDTVVTWQARTNTVPAPAPPSQATPVQDTQTAEEYPPDQFPDQNQVRTEIEVRGPATIQPTIVAPVEPAARPAPPPTPGGPFALGAAGRNAPQRSAEWVGPRPPLIQTPAVQQAPAATRPPANPLVTPPSADAPPPIRPAASGHGRLLGGAYRENGANGHGVSAAPAPPHENPQRNLRSLDAVFGRLAGERKLPDPRERLRHIPGVGPLSNRPR